MSRYAPRRGGKAAKWTTGKKISGKPTNRPLDGGIGTPPISLGSTPPAILFLQVAKFEWIDLDFAVGHGSRDAFHRPWDLHLVGFGAVNFNGYRARRRP